MKVLTGIRAVGSQVLRTTDEFGETIEITLTYSAATQGWYINVSHVDFTLNGQRLYASLNCLWAYAKQIGFGLAVIMTDRGDPFLINDFTTGRVQLAVLTNEELDQIDDLYISERAQ